MHGSFLVFIGAVLIPLSPNGTTGPLICAFIMATLNLLNSQNVVTTFIVINGTENTT